MAVRPASPAGCQATYRLRVIVMCVEGYTSSLAAASLQDLGVAGATDLAGGSVPGGGRAAGRARPAPGSAVPG